MLRLLLLSLFFISSLLAEEKETKPAAPDLPGIDINLIERSVDVQATIALQEGALEFVVCTKDTKEHESLVIVQALPSHIHIALLLLGAKAGHPAIRKVVGEGDDQRWIDVPPKGSPISVSIVVTDKNGKSLERPLSDFISRNEEEDKEVKEENETRLKTFLFAGSHLHGKGEGPKTYLADKSGSVISLSTFGDELLCLPAIYGHENQALQWQADSTHLPPTGSKVTLRLRPQTKKEPTKR